MDPCAIHKQKSHTFAAQTKQYIIQKYLESTREQNANYANVPIAPIAPVTPVYNHHHHQNYHVHQPSRLSHRSHHHVHSRTHSQHYYQTMYPEFNQYYNVSNLMQLGMARSHHSPGNEPPPPHMHNPPQLDCITVMQVCNELGNNIDSSPAMPESRQYSIIRTKRALFKLAYPQMRTTKGNFLDQRTRTYVKAGETISVLGPSKDDRSKVSICYNEKHFDMPHQLTLPPPLTWNQPVMQ